MDISFTSPEIRKLCEDNRKALKQFGTEVAEKLKSRLADIHSATNVLDLVAGEPEFAGNDEKSFTIHLSNGTFLQVQIGHQKIPKTKSGQIDRSKVTRVKIIGITNGHFSKN